MALFSLHLEEERGNMSDERIGTPVSPSSDPREPQISSAALEQLRSRLGAEITIDSPPHLTEVTPDAIRHLAWGIGDRSRIWTDREYGRASLYGDIIAPPTMILAFNRLATGYMGGLPGVHAMYAGSDYTWSKVLRIGDQLKARVIFEDLVPKETQYAGLAYNQITRITFTDQSQNVVADGTSWIFRTERATARRRGKHRGLQPHRYSEEDLNKIMAAVDSEVIRGAEPRYWNDVVEGESLPSIVRGLLRSQTMSCLRWAGAVHSCEPMALRETTSANIPGQQSSTRKEFRTFPSACTGMGRTLHRSGLVVRMTTVDSGLDGWEMSSPIGWAIKVFFDDCGPNSAGLT